MKKKKLLLLYILLILIFFSAVMSAPVLFGHAEIYTPETTEATQPVNIALNTAQNKEQSAGSANTAEHPKIAISEDIIRTLVITDKLDKSILDDMLLLKSSNTDVLAEPEQTPAPEPTPVIDPDKPMVALTFDDGPAGEITSQLLELLITYNSRATFFVQGCKITEDNYELMQLASSLGCEFGNHTYAHPRLTKLSAEQICSELEKTNECLTAAIGEGAALVRVPYGAINASVKENIDYPIIAWSIDTRDWEHPNKDAIFEMVSKSVTDGAIILMHDGHSATVEACKIIIPWLIDQGYQLVTVSELMAAKGIEMQNGISYRYAA